jgi:hypothetical protein
MAPAEISSLPLFLSGRTVKQLGEVLTAISLNIRALRTSILFRPDRRIRN